jgi:hypothetical protein
MVDHDGGLAGWWWCRGIAGSCDGTMTEANLAREFLARLRQVPDATPAKLLAEFRRLVADSLKAKGKAQ